MTIKTSLATFCWHVRRVGRRKQIIRELLHGSVETRGSEGAEVEDKGRDKRRQGETCVLLAFHVTEVSSLPLTAFRDALCRVARP